MSNWILILFVYSSTGVAVTTVPMSNKSLCQYAGSQAVSSFTVYSKTVKFTCVPTKE